jgi:hypothetical protein
VTSEGFLFDSDYSSSASNMLVSDDMSTTEKDVTSRYRDMYKHYLIDEYEKPPSALPDIIGKLCLSTAKDVSQVYNCKPSTSRRMTQNGSNYAKVETFISDNHMMRTQTSLFLPKMPVGSRSEAKQKALYVAGGTEVRDQRVRIDPQRYGNKVTAEQLSEAFCRTINHVGVFAVPHADDSDHNQIHERASNRNYIENGIELVSEEKENRFPLAICLPDATKIGGMLRRNVHPSSSLDEDFDKSFEHGASLDFDIGTCRNIPGLRAVSVAGCPEVTDRGVQVLLGQSPVVQLSTCMLLC